MLSQTIFNLARLAVRRPPFSTRVTTRAAIPCYRSRYYSTSNPTVPPPLPSNDDNEGPEEVDDLVEDAEEGEDEVEDEDLDDYWSGAGYPNLMTPDSYMDMHEAVEFPPSRDNPYGSKVIVRNDPSMFLAEQTAQKALGEGSEADDDEPHADEEGYSPLNHLPLSKSEMASLNFYPIYTRRITQQTGKGKIHRQYALVVVGNGNGLVGYGEGKDDELPRATDKAYAQAVRNMDHVERFEQRTLWTDIETKFGATRVILRPRPLGFGLRCNPNIHQILKAAGIKDISAKVWGSRNPLNVIKATFRMLQAGNAPLAMGNGIGGRGRRIDKGSGVRGKGDVERERGRKMVDLRTY